MQQAFPAGRVNHVIFLTDGLPNIGEIELGPLSEQVAAGFRPVGNGRPDTRPRPQPRASMWRSALVKGCSSGPSAATATARPLIGLTSAVPS